MPSSLFARRLRPLVITLVVAPLLCALASLPVPLASCDADEIRLRDLTILSDVSVESFNAGGLLLTDGRELTWDQVETARLESGDQAAVDRMIERLGIPLHRLKTRLRNGDTDGLIELADSVFTDFQDRAGPSALLVHVSLLEGHLGRGDRPAALLAYLRAAILVREHPELLSARTQPEFASFDFDATTGLTDRLLPVWHDTEHARAALEEVSTQVDRLNPPPDGFLVYAASLAISAGETDRGLAWAARIGGVHRETRELAELLQLHGRLITGQDALPTEFKAKLDDLLPRNRAIALYWLGVTELAQSDRRRVQEAVLILLRLPAEHPAYPELAAGGLFHAYRGLGQLNDSAGRNALARELLENYPGSIFARRLGTE